MGNIFLYLNNVHKKKTKLFYHERLLRQCHQDMLATVITWDMVNIALNAARKLLAARTRNSAVMPVEMLSTTSGIKTATI